MVVTYPIGAGDRGWLWAHRAAAAAVCLGVVAVGLALQYLRLVTYPWGTLLVGAMMGSVLVVALLVVLWLSTTPSGLPPDSRPVI